VRNQHLMSDSTSRRFLITLCLSGILFVGAIAQDRIRELEGSLKSNPSDRSVLMELGRLYHDQAADGDADAIDRGFLCLDRLLNIDTANVVALAYRGDLWAMRARDAWWPPNKWSYLRKGASELDLAVGLAPENMMVRLFRGMNALAAPGFFGRLSIALEDFIVLLKHPAFPEQSKELRVSIYYYAGVAHKRADDYDKARELFKKAISIFPDSDFAKRAQDELKDMGS
jgi:tetratricopeptide (TPR) repeat protein